MFMVIRQPSCDFSRQQIGGQRVQEIVIFYTLMNSPRYSDGVDTGRRKI